MFVLNEKEREGERRIKQKQTATSAQIYNDAGGQKRGPLQLSGPLNGQPSTCGHLGGCGEWGVVGGGGDK